VPNQEPPRVATPSSPSRTFSPSPARSPNSAIRSPHPSVMPRRLTFADSPLPLVVAPSPRVVIEPKPPPDPSSTRAHRAQDQMMSSSTIPCTVCRCPPLP
jgi:hypothetical protein